MTMINSLFFCVLFLSFFFIALMIASFLFSYSYLGIRMNNMHCILTGGLVGVSKALIIIYIVALVRVRSRWVSSHGACKIAFVPD